MAGISNAPPPSIDPFQAGLRVYSISGEMGLTTGTKRRCQLSGCTGMRLGVRWTRGVSSHFTYPCTKGMRFTHMGEWRIIDATPDISPI